MSLPTISMNPWIQAEYQHIRAAGESHNVAEMLAFARPPGVTGTDQAFLEGHCNGSQFASKQGLGDLYAEDAKKAGVSVKGKVYLSSLAAFPGDPRAWVSGRDDAKKVVEERGWGCRGNVNVKMAEVAQPTGGGVSPALVEEHTARAVAAAPEPVKDVAEVRERVKARLKPHWSK